MSFDKDGSRNPPKSRQSIAPQPNKKKRTSSETNAINEDRGGPERGPVIRHRKKVENEIGCDNSPHETKFKLRQPRVSHYFFVCRCLTLISVKSRDAPRRKGYSLAFLPSHGTERSPRRSRRTELETWFHLRMRFKVDPGRSGATGGEFRLGTWRGTCLVVPRGSQGVGNVDLTGAARTDRLAGGDESARARPRGHSRVMPRITLSELCGRVG